MILLAPLLLLLAGPPSAATFPEAVALKSPRQSFNRRYYAWLSDGRIYFKANAERTGVREDWRALPLPRHVDGKVVEIAVDDTYVIAVTGDRTIHTMKGFLEDPARFRWVPGSRWGAPLWRGRGMKLPASTRAWDISYNSVAEDKYYVDRAGNRQSIGGGCTTLYALDATGQNITYLDPWLPADLSYQVCGPRRNAFVAEALSSSGSTVAVVNRHGDLYVRSYDFDISGADWFFFPSTYEDMSQPKVRRRVQPANWWRIPRKLSGRYSDVSDRPRQLPAAEWARQEKIPGAITDRITLTKEGEGGLLRWLRVEGTSPDGRTGYFQARARLQERDEEGNPIPQRWEFVPTGEPLQGRPLENLAGDTTDLTLGPVASHDYPRGELQREAHAWSAAVQGLHPYCSPAILRVTFGNGEVLELLLHTRETIRQAPRAPGLDHRPLELQGAIEAPGSIAGGAGAPGPATRWFLGERFGRSRFVTVKVKATTTRLEIDGLARRRIVLTAPDPTSPAPAPAGGVSAGAR